MNKLMSFVLIISLMLHQPTFAQANNTDTKSTRALVISSLTSDACLSLLFSFAEYNTLGYTIKDLDVSFFGDVFTIPSIENNELINEDQLWYCTLIKKDQLIAVIRMVLSEGEVSSFTISDAYTTELGNKGPDDVLFFDDTLHLLNMEQFQEYNLKQPLKDKILKNQNFTPLEINEEISDSIAVVMNSNSSIFTTSAAAQGRILPNYPIRSGMCWAGAIASIVSYKTGNYVSTTYIDNTFDSGDHTGGDWTEVMNAMNYYFSAPYAPYLVYSYLSFGTIQTTINYNDPALLGYISGSSAHHVALCGYYTDGTNKRIQFMNPGTGTIEWSNYTTGNNFTFSYNGKVWTWDKTVRIRNV